MRVMSSVLHANARFGASHAMVIPNKPKEIQEFTQRQQALFKHLGIKPTQVTQQSESNGQWLLHCFHIPDALDTALQKFIKTPERQQFDPGDDEDAAMHLNVYLYASTIQSKAGIEVLKDRVKHQWAKDCGWPTNS